jgi:hypothetical protein
LISLPEGFDVGTLVSEYWTLGAYIVGAYVLVYSADVIMRALRS